MKDVDFYGARHDMPLTLAGTGEENIIRKISGKQEVKTHLENQGQLGHSDIETTYRAYYYALYDTAEKIEILSSIKIG